ncbi:hypothetical protein V2J09_021496 [Rumex salicifolius]
MPTMVIIFIDTRVKCAKHGEMYYLRHISMYFVETMEDKLHHLDGLFDRRIDLLRYLDFSSNKDLKHLLNFICKLRHMMILVLKTTLCTWIRGLGIVAIMIGAFDVAF